MQVQTEPVLEKKKDFVAPQTYIQQVKDKLKSGEYPTEQVRCFCGADFNDIEIVHTDRYGIPHRMVVCQECGLIRANPRMTKEAYYKFYNNEYRKIYDGFGFNPHTGEYFGLNREIEQDAKFFNSVGKGDSFYEFIEYYDIPVNTVFEIGCDMGAFLVPFKERGCEVIGVDWGEENIKYGQDHGLNLIWGGVDELLRTGKQADLVILNHVIEHFIDLEDELYKIRKLIKPGGLLYVGTPGFYPNDKRKLWQNAHTYQFTADTLTYVMNCCGYDEFYTDEFIKSLWSPVDMTMSKDKKPVDGLEYLKRYLSGAKNLMPRVRSVNKFSLKERKENLDKALSYHYPPAIEVFDNPDNKKRIGIVIGGGPSVDSFIDEIKEKQKNGAGIVCIERMYPWCHKNGITPDYVVTLDASTDVTEGFTHLNKDTTHILAAQAHASVFEKVKGYKNYLFCIPQKGIEQQNYWYKHYYKQMCMVNGGGSVTLCAWAIAMCLGFREQHIYGFDCNYNNGQYANGIAGAGLIPKTFDVKIDDKIFKTTSTFVSFMQQFFSMWGMAKKDGLVRDVKIFGESMVSWASKVDISGSGFWKPKDIKEEKCEK